MFCVDWEVEGLKNFRVGIFLNKNLGYRKQTTFLGLFMNMYTLLYCSLICTYLKIIERIFISLLIGNYRVELHIFDHDIIEDGQHQYSMKMIEKMYVQGKEKN